MRIPTLILLLPFTLAASPSAAQGSRLSFELAGGPSTTSPIFAHDFVSGGFTVLPGTMVTRLSIDDAPVASARVGYRLLGPLMLVAELAQGTTDYHYYQSFTGTNANSYQVDQRGPARRTAFGLGVTSHATIAALPLFIEPEVDILMERLRVGESPFDCAVVVLLSDVPYGCPVYPAWQRTYSVPSVGVGAAVGYTLAPWAALQLRARYSVGRTRTAASYFNNLSPQFNWSATPTSQTIRASQLSVGLRIPAPSSQ